MDLHRQRVKAYGKAFVRNAVMYPDIHLILNCGLTVNPAHLDPSIDEDAEKLEALRQYRLLKDIYPTLEADLTDPKQEQPRLLIEGLVSPLAASSRFKIYLLTFVVCSLLGRSRTRDKRTRACFGIICTSVCQKICRFQPYFLSASVDTTTPSPRACYALSHWTTTILRASLFSIVARYSTLNLFLSVPSVIERLRQGIDSISIGDYYHFMYAGFSGDPDNASEGLLRSSIIVEVCFFASLLYFFAAHCTTTRSRPTRPCSLRLAPLVSSSTPR